MRFPIQREFQSHLEYGILINIPLRRMYFSEVFRLTQIRLQIGY